MQFHRALEMARSRADYHWRVCMCDW